MSPKPPKLLRYRLAKILLVSLLGLFCLLIALLHVLSHLFSLHDRTMKTYVSKFVTDSSDRIIHYYELKQTNAEWNIIFIHGTPAMAADFHEQFQNPFPRANLFALDRPGFGASGPGWRHPSLEQQANVVGLLLPTNGPLRTILVGHSYGGPIALLAAMKFTNRVAGVILVGGSVDPNQERIYEIQRIGDWPAVSWLLPPAFRECNRELLTLRGDLERLQPEIAALSVPVVMVHGTKDPLVPVANVDYLRTQLALANKTNLFESMVLPGYNHFIPWEHPEVVEAALFKLTGRLN